MAACFAFAIGSLMARDTSFAVTDTARCARHCMAAVWFLIPLWVYVVLAVLLASESICASWHRACVMVCFYGEEVTASAIWLTTHRPSKVGRTNALLLLGVSGSGKTSLYIKVHVQVPRLCG